MNATRVRLGRIGPGRYMTKDARFSVVDRYDPSGRPDVREGRNSSIRWRVEDLTLGDVSFHGTLAECREKIAAVIHYESYCDHMDAMLDGWIEDSTPMINAAPPWNKGLAPR